MKYSKFSHKTPHLKGKQHQLDPNLDLKQLVHHATVQYVDRDNDGDVDVYDNPKKKTPDENPLDINVASASKKLMAKQKGELKHTKRGMAYEDLRKWFGKGKEGGVGGGGWDEYNTKGERTGKCARGEDDDGEGPKPKCLSKEKAAKMSKKEIADAVRRKRKSDPVADRTGKGGKPVMSSNKIDEGKKQPDHEHSMARSELATIENAVKRLKSKMKGEGNIEAWVQSKITRAADYIDAAADYLDSGEHNVHGSMDEEKDPCWKGYKQVGMKKKNGKQVPNCVPVSEEDLTIDPKKHRQAQRAAKVRNLAQKGATESERKAAERKTKGPKLFGEDIKLVDKILLEIESEVLCEENKPTNPKLWAKWKSKAKAKFDVYPPAYAKGWAAKGYKSEGGGWKSVKEETIEDLNGNTFAEVIDLVVNEESDDEKYCKKCKKMEKRSECKYGPKTWDEMTDDSEDMEESVRMPSKNGNIIMANLTWRGKYYGIKFFFPNLKVPSRQEIQKEIDKVYPNAKVYSYQVSDYQPGQPLIYVSEDWQKVNRQDKTDGLSQKAVNAYRKENPGSKLKTAVTEKNPEGKRADRRKSFCRRMKGMKSKLTSSETARDPNSRINKSLRRWNCN